MRYNYRTNSTVNNPIFFYRQHVFTVLFLLILSLSLNAQNVTPNYASSSQLSSGKWAKISVKDAGIYKLTFEELQNMQLPVANVPSANIRIYGYGGMLPENAGAARFDDLPEISIKVVDGGDATFNAGDYLLFYSPGPDSWKYDLPTNTFGSIKNIYSDYSYYFITVGSVAGKRIIQANQPSSVTEQIQYYNYRKTINPELENLIKSGRGWYGDFFDIITERDYLFDEISTLSDSEIKFRFSVVARSFWGSTFTLSSYGFNHSIVVDPVQNDFNSNYAQISTSRYTQPAPSTFSSVKVIFQKTNNIDMGWLNFIEVNAEAKLKYNGKQLDFRRTLNNGDVEFVVEGGNSNMVVWDVTNPLSPSSLIGTTQNSNFLIKASLDTLREFILADPQHFLGIANFEPVPNQNLHAMPTPKMLIITHPDFMDQAVRLATYHANKDNISVSIVTPQNIYNEFSSGAQDISAIRDFIKMLWHRAEPSNLPRYVLLFGDASYDFKSRIDSNTNFVPTFQSPESLDPVSSIATDDFFVCIDDHEGGNNSDIPDIGIGRLPVRTHEEAQVAVDKIIHYVEDTENVNGDWRNVIAFVADDEDGNIHMSQADQIATMIDTTFRNFNTDKIFLDAYLQESTAGGQRSPDANAAINERIGKGALIINYTGHGGETGWTKEQILEVKDITGWTNYDKLPVFMTATCEFSRYDDPSRVSGGEYAFLNKNGGAIALFTTARPTYGTPNFNLARIFYNTALKPLNGSMPRLGDIIRMAKTQSGGLENTKKFVLLGDPSMTMAYPEYNVLTTDINGFEVNSNTDTIKALETITIKGIISDNEGNKLSSFNGVVIPTVFDKKSEVVTYGTDGSGPMSFDLWRNVIYKGRVEVINGEFSFTFIVPRDIAYNYGFGKISYYATNGLDDASGNYSNIVIGGFTDQEINDNEGPEVTLYINDSSFKDGGFTNENPVLLAYLSDSSGINTLGNSIGHDLVAILDGNTQHPYILNDYYKADLNTYKSGSLFFPMNNLAPGPHTIRLHVWDVNNNSSETEIHFIVAEGNKVVLSDLEAWPNPVNRTHDNISFILGHNQANRELIAELSVYNLSGTRVFADRKNIKPEGYRTKVFSWNGQETGGHNLSAGFYIANVRLTTSEGFASDKSVKIIITR
ncbi:MAG TPA: type IX secretion system sortase PorU [Lentimicrobium sp.]|nr:type IX secretion system sortase PorU [Lentimicrobium sp.]